MNWVVKLGVRIDLIKVIRLGHMGLRLVIRKLLMLSVVPFTTLAKEALFDLIQEDKFPGSILTL